MKNILLFVAAMLFIETGFATTHKIKVSDFQFSPATTNAVVGDMAQTFSTGELNTYFTQTLASVLVGDKLQDDRAFREQAAIVQRKRGDKALVVDRQKVGARGGLLGAEIHLDGLVRKAGLVQRDMRRERARAGAVVEREQRSSLEAALGGALERCEQGAHRHQQTAERPVHEADLPWLAQQPQHLRRKARVRRHCCQIGAHERGAAHEVLRQ